ncbi:tyrosine-type recombinase/integrase [Streptomyces sp. NPDC090112]|uniref:tyrosine-type recombinase/integrase n=1 Tax=Streptomyces sp. NPDC090112 TaxID=3365949 RepID=UPI00382D1FF3
MNGERALAPPADSGRDPAQAERLFSLVRPDFLAGLGWDEELRIARPSPDHPLIGYRSCVVRNCVSPAHIAGGAPLCPTCRKRWLAGGEPLEDFLVTAMRIFTGTDGACTVPGCARVWRSYDNPVCLSHLEQKYRLGIGSIEQFVVDPRVRPKPALESCGVVACHRQSKDYQGGFCAGHRWSWNEARRKDPGIDPELWRRTTASVRDGTLISFRGLPDLVVAEILFGTQQRLDRHVRLLHNAFKLLCDTALAQQVSSLGQLVVERNTRLAGIWKIMTCDIRVGLATPELEQLRDVWDAEVFGLGRGRTMNFTGLHQEWLRRAAKAWVMDAIPRRYGRNIPNSLMSMVVCLERLSDSLNVNREDHGHVPERLRRSDIEVFQQRLAYLEQTGQVSANLRVTICRWCARFLREIREMGLTRPAQVLAGLPDDFSFRKGDIPSPPQTEGGGRALPREILTQLCERLDALETSRRNGRTGIPAGGRHARIAVEILIDTGRRPDEVQKLPWDCLETDEDGKHVLVYTDFKNNRLGCRLPIPDTTAALIREQRDRVRARFPETPTGRLALFPNPHFNPDGTNPYRSMFLSQLHREWVRTMPALLTVVGEEFDKSRITLYCYRHSYAQRHADAGTPVDVLREFMGHKTLGTTQTYYRVTEKRTRRAVDRLVTLQFDRHGGRLWDQAKALLDHGHARMRIGQVAVPFGICAEPSNVKAGGHACPFRFRCLGCDHFRTDPSYLPDLRAYLDTLLRDRERLAAAGELDDWARVEATPSEEEITRLRSLIRRVESDLEALTPEDREEIRRATAVLRRSRTVQLGMPAIRPTAGDIRIGRDQ